jgi:hypothetical protein
LEHFGFATLKPLVVFGRVRTDDGRGGAENGFATDTSQRSLFYQFQLDERNSEDHLLRRILPDWQMSVLERFPITLNREAL